MECAWRDARMSPKLSLQQSFQVKKYPQFSSELHSILYLDGQDSSSVFPYTLCPLPKVPEVLPAPGD